MQNTTKRVCSRVLTAPSTQRHKRKTVFKKNKQWYSATALVRRFCYRFQSIYCIYLLLLLHLIPLISSYRFESTVRSPLLVYVFIASIYTTNTPMLLRNAIINEHTLIAIRRFPTVMIQYQEAGIGWWLMGLGGGGIEGALGSECPKEFVVSGSQRSAFVFECRNWRQTETPRN